jgi:acetolactate synthase-1/2/3 large subunit
VILVIDSDVPWIPAVNRPSARAEIYCVDVDPVKSQMSMWYIPARRYATASARVAVEQIARFVLDNDLADAGLVAARRAEAARAHRLELAGQEARERPRDGVITAEYLTGCVRRLLDGQDALVLTEVVTNSKAVAEHLRPSRPGSVINHGGGSLGWAGGGAVGAKLACPERTVVALTGDGSYLFGVPSSAQWVARRYGAPALTVVYDNRGWAAPRFSTLRVHPDGAAAAADDFRVSFEPEADLAGIAAAAGGAYAATVSDPDELPGVLKDALAVVHGGRSAVVSVQLVPVASTGLGQGRRGALRHRDAALVDQPQVHRAPVRPGAAERAGRGDQVAGEHRLAEHEHPAPAGQPLLAQVVYHELAQVPHALGGRGDRGG